jgi:hypothetical protein
MRGRVVFANDPATFFTSLGLTAALRTWTMALPSTHVGLGSSTSSKTSGGPKDLNWIAFMRLSLDGVGTRTFGQADWGYSQANIVGAFVLE